MHLIKGQYGFVCYFSFVCYVILYVMVYFIFIFSVNSIVFYEIFYNDVTASRDVTYLFTDPDEICTAYVKIEF